MLIDVAIKNNIIRCNRMQPDLRWLGIRLLICIEMKRKQNRRRIMVTIIFNYNIITVVR